MSQGTASLHVGGADAGLMAEPAPAPHPADAAAASATAAAQQQAEAAAAALLHAEQHHQAQQAQQQQHDEAGVEGEHDEGAYEDASFAGVHAHHLQQDDGEGNQQQQTNLAAEALLASSMASNQQHHHQHERNTASGSALTAAGHKPVAFVTKLHDMVSSTDPAVHNLIHWCGPDDYAEESEERGGDAFVVIDMGDFSREVLPRYYKHNNWQSFQRQLNLYGFRKLNDAHRSQPNAGPTPWVFRHRYFKRLQPGLLIEIQRKNKDVTEAAAGPSKRGAKKRKHEAAMDESKAQEAAAEAGWTDADAQEVMQRYIEEKFSTLNTRIEAQNEALREYSEAMTLLKQRSLELASVSVDMLTALSGAVDSSSPASSEARTTQNSLAYLRTSLSALSGIVVPAPPALSLNAEDGTAVAGPSSSSGPAGGSSRAEKRKQQPEPATLEQLLATFQSSNAAQAAAQAAGVVSAAGPSGSGAGANGHEKQTDPHESNYFAATSSSAAPGGGVGGEADVDATGEEIDEDAPGEETFAEAQQHLDHHHHQHDEDEQMQEAHETEAAMGHAHAHLGHHAQA